MINNQKDIQKTDINKYGESHVPDIKSLENIPVYEFANKKTEKLVTALYLVSDCMDADDAIKGKLRLLGVELLSDMYKLSAISPLEKHSHIPLSLNHIYEILSFVEIAYNIGFVSEMNTNILKKEFASLITDLKEKEEKGKHFTFTLDEKMFGMSEPERPAFGGVSFINNKSPLQNIQLKKTNSSALSLTDRKDRTDKIMSLIKDKKEVSIKDISLAFTDCSEKTIQRELNTLVSKGQVKKTGSKRWSRYAIL